MKAIGTTPEGDVIAIIPKDDLPKLFGAFSALQGVLAFAIAEKKEAGEPPAYFRDEPEPAPTGASEAEPVWGSGARAKTSRWGSKKFTDDRLDSIAAAPRTAKPARASASVGATRKSPSRKPPSPPPARRAAPASAKPKRSRNKICETCGIKFHDPSATNTRKFCAVGRCKRGKPAPQDDRPRQPLGNGGSRVIHHS